MPTPQPNMSISHGTMRPEDLIPTFIEWLSSEEDRANFTADWEFARDTDDREFMDYILEDLFNLLQDSSPEGCYFGAHPGDGADYGWWQHEDYSDLEEVEETENPLCPVCNGESIYLGEQVYFRCRDCGSEFLRKG